MAEPWNQPHESRQHAIDELQALQAKQEELWATLRSEKDPALRMSLLSTFSENRTAIHQLSESLGVQPDPGAGQQYRVEIVDELQYSSEPAPPAREPSILPFGDGPGIPAPPSPHEESSKVGSVAAPVRSVSDLLDGFRNWPGRTVLVGATLVVLLGLAWLLVAVPSNDGAGAEDASDLATDTIVAGPTTTDRVDEINRVLQGLGATEVMVVDRDGVLHILGTVQTEADRQAVVGATRALAGDQSVDDSALTLSSPEAAPIVGQATGRPEAFQAEIDRVVAATPIIFEVGETELTDLQTRILNSVASIMVAYQDLPVTIVGFTDDSGSDENNEQLSLARAESVRRYLVAQGVSEAVLSIEPRGEVTSSGSQALANLERRVEFEVAVPAVLPAPVDDSTLRIAIVAPSARNDLAFTQSMVDAVQVISAERGDVEVAITDNTFVPDEAAAAITGYAEQGFDLVIAHGSQFGAALIDIAPQHPDVAFAWGTASDTFGLPNVYAYDAKAGQGGYVMGAAASLLSQSGVIGVVGPIEVGDAEAYVNGFEAGARTESTAVDVRVAYTGSFSDVGLAAETAQAHLAAGSDVMTGSAQMVVGAVSAAGEAGALWFGTQSNQASLAPDLVVASQVYHWEVILRPIIDGIEQGALAGQVFSADLANGGLVIEYNPTYPLPEGVRQRADAIAEGIKSGAVVVPG